MLTDAGAAAETIFAGRNENSEQNRQLVWISAGSDSGLSNQPSEPGTNNTVAKLTLLQPSKDPSR